MHFDLLPESVCLYVLQIGSFPDGVLTRKGLVVRARVTIPVSY